MKMHPPATSIEELVAVQPPEFLMDLQQEIVRRRSRVAAYGFINAVIARKRKKLISDSEIDKMGLLPFCVKTGGGYGFCKELLSYLNETSKYLPDRP